MTSMLQMPRSVMRVATQYQPALRELAIDADAVFTSPLIKTWRKLPDRENCVLDATLHDGRAIRWHVKRYDPARGFTTPADDEARGHRALEAERIPTASLVGWGHLIDRRSFVIFEDLAGFRPADKSVQAGFPFESLIEPTADVAAQLHNRGLHHRDLYLCHFMVKAEPGRIDVRLIDPARVRRLPGLFRNRWIVKDLSQFWYSTTELTTITDDQRHKWLGRYVQQRGLQSIGLLQSKVERKSAWIARHDAALRQRQPTRNISIPAS